MFTLNGLLIGLAMIGIGVLIVRFSYPLTSITGSQDWLERFTGPGTTNFMYKMFGLALIIGGLLAATGYGNNAMSFVLSPLVNMFSPGK